MSEHNMVATAHPSVHDLKCDPEYFAEVAAGRKTFELRRDDRDYHQGDTIFLREFDRTTQAYTGRQSMWMVGYVLRGSEHLAPGYCAFSLARLNAEVPTIKAPVPVSPERCASVGMSANGNRLRCVLLLNDAGQHPGWAHGNGMLSWSDEGAISAPAAEPKGVREGQVRLCESLELLVVGRDSLPGVWLAEGPDGKSAYWLESELLAMPLISDAPLSLEEPTRTEASPVSEPLTLAWIDGKHPGGVLHPELSSRAWFAGPRETRRHLTMNSSGEWHRWQEGAFHEFKQVAIATPADLAREMAWLNGETATVGVPTK